MLKTCKDCGQNLPINSFEVNRNSCKKCRYNKRRLKHKHVCEYCRNDFSSRSKDSRFCSRQCVGKNRRRRIRDSCSFCEKEIEYLPRDKKWEYHYCNQECRGNHLKLLMVGEGNPNWSRVKKKCDGCSKNILVRPFDLKNTKHHFCNYECYKENIGKYYRGENNNFWNPNLTAEERERGRSYPEYDDWRLTVFRRDRFTCQCCGDNSSGNLIAHHILNYSEHKDLRTDADNGITLCESCHIDFHTTYGFSGNNKEQLKTYINNFNKQTTLF